MARVLTGGARNFRPPRDKGEVAWLERRKLQEIAFCSKMDQLAVGVQSDLQNGRSFRKPYFRLHVVTELSVHNHYELSLNLLNPVSKSGDDNRRARANQGDLMYRVLVYQIVRMIEEKHPVQLHSKEAIGDSM
jgi:hypothetical protein